jgi:uncharacterized protein (TIGR02147 family)
MNEQIAIQKLLQQKFEEIRIKNPAFSLRAFSRRLNVNPSTLTRVLAGERRVSRPLAERLCERLCLDPQERSEVIGGFPQKKKYHKAGLAGDNKAQDYLQLTADQFRLVCEWYHYGILSLLKTKGFQNDPEWMAERLGISVREVSAALARMERLEMIQKGLNGEWIRLHPRIRTTDDVLNLSLQRAHRQNLELGREALTHVPVELRDFTAITMPTNPDLIPKAKELIRKFQEELSALLESEPGTEVYKFCTQLIPLTKTKNKTKTNQT